MTGLSISRSPADSAGKEALTRGQVDGRVSGMSRWSPRHWPNRYRMVFVCCAAVILLGGGLAWFGGPWRYTNLLGVVLVFLGFLVLGNLRPADFDSDD